MTQTIARRRVALALQGGGSHGAYSWGVLDRLLDEDIDIVAVSGASAGALNGAALVSGLVEGGRDGARAALERLWRSVARNSPLGALHVPEEWPLAPLLESMIARGLEAAKLTSRYVAPFLPGFQDMRTLRRVVDASVDLSLLGHPSAIPFHVAATRVANGQARLFDNGEVTLDALMASACLPELFSAVQIDNEPYWDGGYSANPALEPLVFADGPVDDLLVVQVTPFSVDADLQSLAGVMRRTSDISFNACLMRDLKALAEVQRLAREGSLEHELLERLRIHLVQPPASVAAGSKVDTRWSTIERLHHTGHAHMSAWLENTAFTGELRTAAQVLAAPHTDDAATASE